VNNAESQQETNEFRIYV